MYKFVLKGVIVTCLLFACTNKKRIYRAKINERKHLQDSSLQLKFSFTHNNILTIDSTTVIKGEVIEGDSIWVEYNTTNASFTRLVKQ